jgi:phosphopantothenoylcysteine synthetase/decarboxylase
MGMPPGMAYANPYGQQFPPHPMGAVAVPSQAGGEEYDRKPSARKRHRDDEDDDEDEHQQVKEEEDNADNDDDDDDDDEDDDEEDDQKPSIGNSNYAEDSSREHRYS